jgi:alkyl hydroperoxide reductase subunit F
MSSELLSSDILNAVTNYAADLKKSVTLVLQTGSHDKREELVDFLSAIATTSPLLTLEQRDTQGSLRSPISFTLEADGAATGITFSGIPSGHEFNSLILAILQGGGASELKLDASIVETVESINDPIRFEVFISLSCHNCPDVVQTLNKFALLNQKISTEMIDGGLFQDIIDDRDIQGVPSVFMNGELFMNGKVDIANVIDKLRPMAAKPDTTSEQPMPEQDVVVIGGGPAAISAAIYSARKGLSVTVIAETLGGQVKDTMDIENLISVPATTGTKLTGNLHEHLREYDITLREHLRVTDIEQGELKSLSLSSGEIFQARTVIIATGANWKELGIPGEKENIGNGVAFCPHCDGPFFKGKDIAVVGGGNSGIEAALDLSGITKSVTVLEFLPTLKADQILVDRAVNKPNISIVTNAACTRISTEDGKVNAVEYTDRATDTENSVPIAGVFVQIGLEPNSEFLKDLVELSDYGEIIINEHGETSQPGIFACGDVTTIPYKQIVIAMGEGAKTSLAASDYLMRQSETTSLGAAAG